MKECVVEDHEICERKAKILVIFTVAHQNNSPCTNNKDTDNPNLIFWYKYKYWKKIGLHKNEYTYRCAFEPT